jgi:dTDP-glucose pyrophosphorylase
VRYGSIPAGGLGTRLQPIGFSKELAPVGGRAVIEYILERLVVAGIERIFINTAEDKMDLVRYLAAKSPFSANCVFLVRERKGLLDGIVQPAELLRPDDELYFGLPDTGWFPRDGYTLLSAHAGAVVLGLFDTGTPERFDSVAVGEGGRIESVHVKVQHPRSPWTWGIGKIRVSAVPALRASAEAAATPFFGDAVHVYASRHPAYAVNCPGRYLDIGRMEDYRAAEAFLREHAERPITRP